MNPDPGHPGTTLLPCDDACGLCRHAVAWLQGRGADAAQGQPRHEREHHPAPPGPGSSRT